MLSWVLNVFKKQNPPQFTIGEPVKKSFSQTLHVAVDADSPLGLVGLPTEWETILTTSGMSKDKIMKNPDAVIKILGANESTLLGKPKTSNMNSSSSEVADGALSLEKIKVIEDVDSVYPVRTEIGRGASGIVYRTGFAEADGRSGHIALKVMDINVDERKKAGADNFLKALLSEVEVLMLSQPIEQIVHFYDAFIVQSEKNRLWVAMEYLGGGSLTAILNHTKGIPDEMTAYVIHELLTALVFLHKNNLLHRDVKSDNILFSTDGAARLTDFGFCARLDCKDKKRNSVVGTPCWMPPEVIQGLPYDSSADIWSTGITAIECAEGAPPCLALPSFQALFAIVCEPSPVLKKPAEHSPLLADFLTHCLGKEPESRWTAEQLLKHQFLTLACRKEDFLPLISATRKKKVKDGKGERAEEGEK